MSQFSFKCGTQAEYDTNKIQDGELGFTNDTGRLYYGGGGTNYLIGESLNKLNVGSNNYFAPLVECPITIGTGNKILSNYSTAIGEECITGQKAYYISAINWEKCQILLSESPQRDYSTRVHIYPSTTDLVTTFADTSVDLGFENPHFEYVALTADNVSNYFNFKDLIFDNSAYPEVIYNDDGSCDITFSFVHIGIGEGSRTEEACIFTDLFKTSTDNLGVTFTPQKNTGDSEYTHTFLVKNYEEYRFIEIADNESVILSSSDYDGFGVHLHSNNNSDTASITLKDLRIIKNVDTGIKLDYISIIQPEDHLTRKRYITNVTGNVITFNSRFGVANEFDADSIDRNWNNLDENDYTLYCPDKPDVGAVVISSNCHAKGYNCAATGSYSIAEGVYCISEGSYSHAEGQSTRAGYAAHSEGAGTVASAKYAHSEGFHTISDGLGGHSEGYYTISRGDYSHSEGSGTVAGAAYSHSEGYNTEASGLHAHVEGKNGKAEGESSHAEGNKTRAIGDHSHAEGNECIANKASAHAEGDHTSAMGAASHAEGFQNLVEGEAAHVEGYSSSAYGVHSHAEGHVTVTFGTATHAEGWETKAYGEASHVEGIGSTTRRTDDAQNNYDGNYAHAEGSYTIASGYAAHAEGDCAHAIGDISHAEGFNTKASGYISHAEGNTTISCTDASHAEGINTVAGGYRDDSGNLIITGGTAAHAEGENSSARGYNSHVGGAWSHAIGNNSFVHGFNCAANCSNSAAFGEGIQTSGLETVKNQFAVGQYNSVINNALFQVGCGTDNNSRANAFTVTTTGRIILGEGSFATSIDNVTDLEENALVFITA